MSDVPTDSKGFSLRRWSQRKHAAARGTADTHRAPAPDAHRDGPPPRAQDADARVTAENVAASGPPAPRDAVPVAADADGTERAVAATAPGDSSALPSLDTLTIDSDYAPFMQAGVDDEVKRGALRKLFSDPRFNVMDGLDVYIDDYSKPDPIDPAIVRTLAQARYIFNPPATRVNADGHVEDVPDEPAADDARKDMNAGSASVEGQTLARADAVQPLTGGADASLAQPTQRSTVAPDEPAFDPRSNVNRS